MVFKQVIVLPIWSLPNCLEELPYLMHYSARLKSYSQEVAAYRLALKCKPSTIGVESIAPTTLGVWWQRGKLGITTNSLGSSS